jgi:hypothetical protein
VKTGLSDKSVEKEDALISVSLRSGDTLKSGKSAEMAESDPRRAALLVEVLGAC